MRDESTPAGSADVSVLELGEPPESRVSSHSPWRTSRGRRNWTSTLSGWSSALLCLPIAIVFSFLVLYPAVKLVQSSFTNGWSDYSTLLHGAELKAIKTTVVTSLIVTLISLLIGTAIAWTLRMSQRRLLKALLWAGVFAPMSMSVVVKNFAFYVILGRFGLLNWASSKIGIAHELLFTPTAVTIGMTYSLFPYAVIPLYLTLTSIPDTLLQAAESLGARYTTRLRTIVLPLATPGYFATGILLFVLSMGFFVSPIVLGGPKATFIASMVQNDIQQTYDVPAASAKAVFLIAVVLLLIATAYAAIGRRRFERALG